MLKLGVVGIGGYASYVARGVFDAAKAGGAVRFVAACDPLADQQPSHRDALLQAGVPVLGDFDQLLERDINAVWLPVPIDLHRPFTERALAAGKAVIVEKPAAGTVDDLDAMIAARDRSGLPVAVGFQNLFDPNAWAAKRQILDGLIGSIQSATVFGCWPRGENYYSRAAWAGRASRDGTWVLDSPLNNAMAHFVNLALFLLGDAPAESAVPDTVDAELFRAYDIEMYDTCAVRTQLGSGVPLFVALTHACRETLEPIVAIHGTKGSLRFLHETNRFEFTDTSGQVMEALQAPFDPIPQILGQFGRRLAGDARAQIASLENARSHTLLVNAVSEAATVAEVPATKIELIPSAPNGYPRRVIEGIEDVLHDCVRSGKLPSAISRNWLAGMTGRFRLKNYRSFSGPCVDRQFRSETRLLVAVGR